MTNQEELSELGRTRRAIRFRAEKITEHQQEITYHNGMIETHLKFQRDAEKRLRHFYRDSGMVAYDLMSESDKAKIDRMPRSETPCEYCGADEVREGKKSVCLNCLHDNSKPKQNDEKHF